MALWGEWGFQNFVWIVSSLLEGLHDFIMVWLTVVLSLVMLVSWKTFSSPMGVLLSDSSVLETVWTMAPVLILISIASPSILLLLIQDATNFVPISTIKVVSNQWNWQSETNETVDHVLDLESTEVLTAYENPITLKMKETIRLVTISTDVLHSLGIPSLGVKLDAAPGRISVSILETVIPGIYSGSCYELCGSGHSAMPLTISAS